MGRLKSYHFYLIAAVCFLTLHLIQDYQNIKEKNKYKKLYTDIKEQYDTCNYGFTQCKFLYKRGCNE